MVLGQNYYSAHRDFSGASFSASFPSWRLHQSTSAPQNKQHTFSEYCSPSSIVIMISSSFADSPSTPSGCPLKNTSAMVEPLLTSATGVTFGLLTDFLDMLFFLCAFEDRLGAAWSSTGRWSDMILLHAERLDLIDSLARCNACSAMHRTCNHLRQPALEHCTINSSGFCGASSTQIFRKSCKFLLVRCLTTSQKRTQSHTEKVFVLAKSNVCLQKYSSSLGMLVSSSSAVSSQCFTFKPPLTAIASMMSI